MTAGYAEEVLFRLILLPLVFTALAKRAAPSAAAIVSALIVGLAFAALHQLGAPRDSVAHLVTRVIFPGTAMSLAFLWVGPSFLVVAHLAAHLAIPLLFR
jgi:membrane protease YdiL (CAAX protease family)